ncbi:DNA helicase UvrD [Antarcticibacterium flavum]|uniref:DNA 3'-5' helicase n=1 Tax=Antarcticibacterium flavum TaxID=2058175 RepID=A0A5B7X503_9FLAO|nr:MULTISPECIES: UvrD-helicase domain-containing protein [Antarcticibacterium]MCM4160154.1 DNA helicase UvrD [Antarcticibacterium sp. W02-3]QCY69703.1 DNA helicase UvrD [Antarcticibacterium flavum]
MQTPNLFRIYNASAGSGKTYTLVRDYLLLLLRSSQQDAYRNILAITFTNKAVAEMKTRVIAALYALSRDTCQPSYQNLLDDLVKETGQTDKEISVKAGKILKSILHNYASFDISTIDRFTHKIIRTFAKDLGIPVNFEVEMNTQQILQEAVDRVINRAGEDRELTRVLVNFTLTKTDEDKSWDITKDLNKFAKILLNEGNQKHLKFLKEKSLEDYRKFSDRVKSLIKTSEENIATIANHFFTIVEEGNLSKKDFKGGYVFSYFSKLKSGDYKVNFTANWQENIATDRLYAASVPQDKKDILDDRQQEIALLFDSSKTAIIRREYLRELFFTITPLSLLSEIASEMEHIKRERSLVLISDFNPTIAAQVKDQPAPFIYERLGERYRNYFIDEFQDTSQMQWTNITPLIDHALSAFSGNSEPACLTLVGDAKQSIYRFRGGKAEQFIDLYGDSNPFNVEKEVTNLPYNYRSSREIVEFNNSFFSFLAEKFEKQDYRELFKASGQKAKKENPGYVQIDFLETENSEQEKEMQPERVFEIIQELEEKKVPKSDICILTRTRNQSFTIANFLSEKGLTIVSSESLLVSNSPEVIFINTLLEFSLNPEDKQLKWKVLKFLVEKLDVDDGHRLISTSLELDETEFFNWLEDYDLYFNLSQIRELSIFEAAEYILRSFSLVEGSNAYIQFYLDFVFEKTTGSPVSITQFLEYWEQERERLSISVPKTGNAIQIMTIHKSKGLEFPVVIYPFANTKIRDISKESLWLPLPEDLAEIPFSYFKASSKMLNWGEFEENAYQELVSQTEFDAINILYVAFTRASRHLYIISSLDLKKGQEYEDRVSGLLIGYLKSRGLWTDSSSYYFGSTEYKVAEIEIIDAVNPKTYISSSTQNEVVRIVTHTGSMWGSNRETAVNTGNLVHNILSETDTTKDIGPAMEKFLKKEEKDPATQTQMKELLSQVVTHPQLATYFREDAIVKRERDIISPGGEVLRPDRLNFEGNRVTILDYKTGKLQPQHREQMQQYAGTLESMGYEVEKKILIYINEEVSLSIV